MNLNVQGLTTLLTRTLNVILVVEQSSDCSATNANVKQSIICIIKNSKILKFEKFRYTLKSVTKYTGSQ